LVLEYFIVNGNQRAAECFAHESGATAGPSLDTIDNRVRINELICAGDVEAAVVELNRIDRRILEDNPGLHFSLTIQQYIEILRGGASMAALEFARTALSPFADMNEEYAADIQKGLSLLMFAASGSYPEGLAEYFNVQRRNSLVVAVNKAVLKSFSHGTESKLHHALRVLDRKQKDVGDKL
ncbi:unnamed protein product, partial [Ectocarpus fasciculatus]